MNDYSDLMLAMGAMVIFSILLMNTNRSLLRSDTMQVETELEHTAISLAQGVIDEMRVSYEAIEPGSPNYGQSVAASRSSNPNFDYDDGVVSITWPEETVYGEYEVEVKLYHVERDFPDVIYSGVSPQDHQRMDVSVSSAFLSNTITLSYIKSRY